MSVLVMMQTFVLKRAVLMIFLQRCLMGGGGVVIDNNVNDDTIKDDGFVDSISAENVVDD